MTEEEHRPVVLVVEDERQLADLYTRFLEETYTVRTAYGGEQAVQLMSDAVDVLLLDRRMPGRSGREVLEAVRDRGYDCRVAMVTAVSPDDDIIEMGFDDYLRKPVDKTDLHEVIDRLLELDTYDELMQEYYQLTSKKSALEAENSDVKLAESDRYAELVATIDDLETDLEATRETVAESDVRSVLSRSGWGDIP